MKVSGVSSYRWTILLLATLVQVGVSILQQAPAALGPVLIRDLDLSRAQIGLLSSAIWGGMLLGMLPVGLLIDRHGERRLIVAGVTAMALLVLWATQLRAFVLLLILFLLASIGAASSAPGVEGHRRLVPQLAAGRCHGHPADGRDDRGPRGRLPPPARGGEVRLEAASGWEPASPS